MASKVLKCPSCNVVINEVLAFICNKIDVMNEESISHICVSAFDETDILAAKNLLFDSISTTKRKKIRKRQGKTLRNIDDIICILKETDPEDIPTFVARDLHRLPPVLFDHVDVTRLLKDLLTMRCEMQRIYDEYATVNQVKQLQLEIESLKNSSSVGAYNQHVTVRRGIIGPRPSNFEYESGPLGLSPQLNMSLREGSAINSSRCAPTADESTDRPAVLTPPSPPAVSHSTVTRPTTTAPAIHTAAPIDSTAVCETIEKSYSDILQEGEWKTQYRKRDNRKIQNRFIGKMGKATVDAGSKFRAADSKVPLYIYNVSKDTSMCDIITYVKSKTDIDVRLEKMNMKLMKDYDAYKVFVPKHKQDMFLNDDFWPDGIAYRPFVDFGHRRAGGTKYQERPNGTPK
jgi:hypothetical protein